MRYIIYTLAFLLTLHSFGQQQATATQVVVESTTINERELVLSNESTSIKVPLTTDLNNYTHLALVSIYSLSSRNDRNWTDRKELYDLYEDRLITSPLTIVNPFKLNKNQAKKNHMFLKNIKKPEYLYFYYNRGQNSGNDDISTTLVVRDYKNKIIYSAVHKNTPIEEILFPLIGF